MLEVGDMVEVVPTYWTKLLNKVGMLGTVTEIKGNTLKIDKLPNNLLFLWEVKLREKGNMFKVGDRVVSTCFYLHGEKGTILEVLYRTLKHLHVLLDRGGKAYFYEGEVALLIENYESEIVLLKEKEVVYDIQQVGDSLHLYVPNAKGWVMCKKASGAIEFDPFVREKGTSTSNMWKVKPEFVDALKALIEYPLPKVAYHTTIETYEPIGNGAINISSRGTYLKFSRVEMDKVVYK